VFGTNRGGRRRTEYGCRREIESGYRSIGRVVAATTSRDVGLRFLYVAFACLLDSIWRAVGPLVQAESTGEHERPPVVTADGTLALLKTETGLGEGDVRSEISAPSGWLHRPRSRQFARAAGSVR
jgi:hypothetical protein